METGPEKRLKFRYRSVKDLRLPIEVGNWPLKEFWSTLKLSRCVRFPRDSGRWPVNHLQSKSSFTTVSSLQVIPDQLQAPAVFVVFHPTDVVLARSSRTASSLPGIAEQVGRKIMTRRRARTVRGRAGRGDSLIRGAGGVAREGAARGVTV